MAAPRLVLDPGCSPQETYRLYYARLTALRNDGFGRAAAFAAFREANREIEARLRTSLPALIANIDSLYTWAAKHAR